MCGCKDCQGITLFKGKDGRGIVSITAQEDGTFIYLYTDGTTYISPDLTGPQGIQGPTGPAGPAGTNGTNGTDGVIILHSEHPKDGSVGIGRQVVGDPAGYTLVSWEAVPTGTIIEMEFDLHSVGPPTIDTAHIGFYLNESNTYLPADIGTLAIPLNDDDYQALNVKFTLTKNTDTEGYVSMEATVIAGGSNAGISKVWGMSKFIVLATGVGIIEKIEVLVEPVNYSIILDRVIIKQINP